MENNFFGLITRAVGNNMENDDQDVRRVKNVLHNTGFKDEPAENGIIDRPTDESIKRFQTFKGLKVDGILKPGGETEKAIEQELKENNLLDYKEEIQRYGFSEEGTGHRERLVKYPLKATKAWIISENAKKTVEKAFPQRRNHGNNDLDAARHALWTYKMTKSMGAETAREFSKAHERENIRDQSTTKGKTLMDLENGEVGIRLALDAKNRNRDDLEVILEAFKKNNYLKNL